MEKARGPLCSSVGRAVSRPQSRRRWKTEWITLSREAWGGLTESGTVSYSLWPQHPHRADTVQQTVADGANERKGLKSIWGEECEKSTGEGSKGFRVGGTQEITHRARGGRCGQDLIIPGPDCRAEELGHSLWWGHVCPKRNSIVQVGRHRLGTVRRLQPTQDDEPRPQGLAQNPRWLEQGGSPLWS